MRESRLRAELPEDPDALAAGDLLDFDDRFAAVAAAGDEVGFRVLYAVLVAETPTRAAIERRVDAPAEEVGAALADLVEAGAVGERMACLVDGEATVYETTELARRYLVRGPVAALAGEDRPLDSDPPAGADEGAATPDQ